MQSCKLTQHARGLLGGGVRRDRKKDDLIKCWQKKKKNESRSSAFLAQNATLFRNEGAGKDIEILYHLFFDLLKVLVTMTICYGF